MKIEQLDLFTPVKQLTSGDIKFGSLFLYKNKIYMSVKPVSFMLNSTLVQENLAAGKRFCVCVENGRLGIIKGTEPVEAVEATLQYKIK